jgi:hypothetical protein
MVERMKTAERNVEDRMRPELSPVPAPGQDLVAAIAVMGPARPVLPIPFGRNVPLLGRPARIPPSLEYSDATFAVTFRPLNGGHVIDAHHAKLNYSGFTQEVTFRRPQIGYVIAAYDADILGESKHYGDGSNEERALRRHVGHGRALLAKLATWPWVVYANGERMGRLPRRWWEGDAIREAWQCWVS